RLPPLLRRPRDHRPPVARVERNARQLPQVPHDPTREVAAAGAFDDLDEVGDRGEITTLSERDRGRVPREVVPVVEPAREAVDPAGVGELPRGVDASLEA